jgi:hypothetical protein
MMTCTMGEKMTAGSRSRLAIVWSVTFPIPSTVRAGLGLWPAGDIYSSALSPGGVAWPRSRKRREQVLEVNAGKKRLSAHFQFFLRQSI